MVGKTVIGRQFVKERSNTKFLWEKIRLLGTMMSLS